MCFVLARPLSFDHLNEFLANKIDKRFLRKAAWMVETQVAGITIAHTPCGRHAPILATF